MIINSPCHIVTLKYAVRFHLGYYNNKTDVDVKEVVRIYISTISPFTIYYYYSPPLCEVVFNIIISYLELLKLTEVFN